MGQRINAYNNIVHTSYNYVGDFIGKVGLMRGWPKVLGIDMKRPNKVVQYCIYVDRSSGHRIRSWQGGSSLAMPSPLYCTRVVKGLFSRYTKIHLS